MANYPSSRFERILESARKPASYLGCEKNSVRKDPATVKGTMALAFPDLYDIGMSHLGLKILYSVINRTPDLMAERVFAPEDDFAKAMRDEGATLMSLESKRPLAEFDVVGFTIPYELSYTTILWMLRLADIPLRTADRGAEHPLIIGGGAGVYNPEPIADFFDFFLIGDGEKATPEILRLAAATRGVPRMERLEKFARIPGVYVPSFFDVEYGTDGKIARITPKLAGYDKVERIHLPTLSESPYPFDMVIPFGQPVQDRLSVEIDRGCTQGCRFCQAGTTYRPVRERTPDEVMEIIEKGLAATGYGEFSLASLSAGDYSKTGPLLTMLMDRYADDRISVSMPSLRSGTVTDEIIEQVGRVRRTGFTITAEAGSQRLRAALNKKVADEDIFGVASKLLAGGWQTLKLYFMLGLPTETDEDVESIYHLAAKLAALRDGRRSFKNISVSASNFVPKAHTAFQWKGQDTIENLVAKKERLFGMIKSNKRLKLKWHDARMSHLEAAFARGDRRLSRVVETAFDMGARLDAWTERFDFDRWTKAFETCGLSSPSFANRDFALDEVLPWDHIDTGLSKKYFLREWDNAQKGIITADCRTEKCLGCGLDPNTCFTPYEIERRDIQPRKPSVETGRFRYRLRFEKLGLSKFFSHLELQNIIFRAIRIGGLPMAYSQGFSPHPRISFGQALPVGVESEDEAIDMELAEYMGEDAILNAINGGAPEGIRFIGCEPIEVGVKSIASMMKGYACVAEFDDNADRMMMAEAVARFNNAESVIISKKSKDGHKMIDIRPMVDKLSLDEAGSITFEIHFSQRGSAQPGDVTRALFPNGEARPLRIVKKRTLNI